jgi:hypothetical protein
MTLYKWTVVLSAVLFLACPEVERRPANDYLIPYQYRGWIAVEYSNANCTKALTNGRIIIVVRPSGRACTSSPFAPGEAVDRFFFVDGDHIRPLPTQIAVTRRVFSRCVVPSRDERRFETFYVADRGQSPAIPFNPCELPDFF